MKAFTVVFSLNYFWLMQCIVTRILKVLVFCIIFYNNSVPVVKLTTIKQNVI